MEIDDAPGADAVLDARNAMAASTLTGFPNANTKIVKLIPKINNNLFFILFYFYCTNYTLTVARNDFYFAFFIKSFTI